MLRSMHLLHLQQHTYAIQHLQGAPRMMHSSYIGLPAYTWQKAVGLQSLCSIQHISQCICQKLDFGVSRWHTLECSGWTLTDCCDGILLCAGGKDSTVLAHLLTLLNKRHNYGLNLFLLSIDEGITGSLVMQLP